MKARSRMLLLVFFLTGVIAARGVAQNGVVDVRFGSSQAGTRQHSVMVSLIRDSGVVEEGESVVPSGRRFSDVAPGVYDVRVEGAGIVTQVKRGVHVTANQTLNLEFVLRPGSGAEVTQYAAAVLSREEIEARLRKLEAAVTDLQRAAPRRPD